MYLSDRDLKKLLPELDIKVEGGFPAFDPDAQIATCSIDLRLGSSFWRPQSRKIALDLRKPRLFEVQPSRYYRRESLAEGQVIVIKPGQLLLGRTLEQFSVPNGHLFDLTGRSSFARLGLMVNVTGGHINPGWRGHMTLQLVNTSPTAIRITPGLPICQARVARLSSDVDRPYGTASLGSLYTEDDGGPSYWWRDKRVKALYERLDHKSVESKAVSEMNTLLVDQEPEVVERLERFVDRAPAHTLSNSDEFMEAFAAREGYRKLIRTWAINLSRGLFTVTISASLWLYAQSPRHDWHYALWVASFLFLVASIYAFRAEVGDHFDEKALRKAIAKR